MLTLLGLNKMLAIYVGPVGYAAIGNFQNAVQMITTLGSGAINSGVVKYTAEYYENEIKQQAVWRTAGCMALFGSFLAGVGVIFFRESLALFFLQDKSLSTVFIWFALTLVFFIFNTLLLAILNGKKEIKSYVIVSIVGSIAALLVTSFMAMQLGLMGALIALAIHPSIAFFATAALCYRAAWFKISYLFGWPDKQVLTNLAKFMLMALTSTICVPVVHILVRNHLSNTLGLSAAGYWEAMWRLSAAYLSLVTTTLSVYYLPRLSELKELSAIKKEIMNGYKIILPIAVVCGIIIYILRDFIIGVLFTSEFIPMRELFAWQLFGDTLKIGSWILAFLMLGKAMVRLFLVTEIIFGFGFWGLTYWLTEVYGLKGVAMAHAINYLIYWVTMWIVFKKILNGDHLLNKEFGIQ